MIRPVVQWWYATRWYLDKKKLTTQHLNIMKRCTVKKYLFYNSFFLNNLDCIMRSTLINLKLASNKVENLYTSRFKRYVLWKTFEKSNKSLKCNVLENHTTLNIGVD